MPKVTGWGAIALATVLVVGACSSSSLKGGTGGAGAGGMGVGGEGAHGGNGAGGQDAGLPDVPDGSPDAISCCPTDSGPILSGTGTLIGPVYLGGPRLGFNPCLPSYDLSCTTNWRLEPDQYGCLVWHWDTDLSCRLDGSSNHFDAGDGGN
jgi:hypothetical protein